MMVKKLKTWGPMSKILLYSAEFFMYTMSPTLLLYYKKLSRDNHLKRKVISVLALILQQWLQGCRYSSLYYASERVVQSGAPWNNISSDNMGPVHE